jgi:hypothetical protein
MNKNLENPNDDYVVSFKGARLSKREANKVGSGIIFGLFGVVVSLFLFGTQNRLVSIAILSLFGSVGYFLIGNKLFKK